MTTLYDVMDYDGEFLMRAPLSTVSMFLCLHPDAQRRIVAETEKGKPCELWKHNDRFRVLKAHFNLGTTVVRVKL